MALAFTFLAFLLAPKYGDLALPAALTAVWLGALAAGWGYFQLRRALGLGNLDFLRAFFGGLALRFAVLLVAGLVLHFATAWNTTVFMVSLALSYPLYLAFEAWRVSGDMSGKQGSREGSS